MFKNKYLLVLCCFIIVGIIFLFNRNNSTEKFYLDDKYYNNGSFVNIDSDSFDKVRKGNYILFASNNYCSFPKPCDEIFKEFMKKYKIDFLFMSFDEFKKTYMYKTVKYVPSIVIVKNGKIVSYLDAESDDDLNKYQDIEEFEKWIKNYIYLKK